MNTPFKAVTNDWKPQETSLYALLGTIVLIWIRCTLKIGISSLAKKDKIKKQPPFVRDIQSLSGFLALSFIWKPLAFVHKDPTMWKRHSVRVRMFIWELYIIQGADDLLKYLKNRSLSDSLLHPGFLERVWKLPRTAASIRRQDKSGINHKPLAGSTTNHQNRIQYRLRVSHHRQLLGPGQESLMQSFEDNVTNRLFKLDIEQAWRDMADFKDIFESEVTAAMVDSIVGSGLLQKHPDFVNDLWTIDHNIMKFYLGLPRFFNRDAHAARDRALTAVRDWQMLAKLNSTPGSDVADGGYSLNGTAAFRERIEILSAVDGYTSKAIASEELAFIWGATTNAIVATYWATLETFRDPELLEKIKKEVENCVRGTTPHRVCFDTTLLLRQPMLQAVFAETLRLHAHGLFVRYCGHDDVQINTWTLTKNRLAVASSTPASMDPQFWCRGNNTPSPDQFWPGRFLTRGENGKPQEFTLSGTEGHWIPFGVGPHACPGRNLAKLQLILVVASMVALYDCEVKATEHDLSTDQSHFPFGSIPPRGKVSVQIRRRKTQPV